MWIIHRARAFTQNSTTHSISLPQAQNFSTCTMYLNQRKNKYMFAIFITHAWRKNKRCGFYTQNDSRKKLHPEQLFNPANKSLKSSCNMLIQHICFWPAGRCFHWSTRRYGSVLHKQTNMQISDPGDKSGSVYLLQKPSTLRQESSKVQ